MADQLGCAHRAECRWDYAAFVADSARCIARLCQPTFPALEPAHISATETFAAVDVGGHGEANRDH
jgi:hypothetical protein